MILNRVIQADVLEGLSQIDDESIDLIVTSPPYANARAKQYGGHDPDEYVEWFLPVAKELQRVLRKPGGSFILNIKEGVIDSQRSLYVYDLVSAMVRQLGWRWHDEFVWHKTNGFTGRMRRRTPDAWEHCYWFTVTAQPYFDETANHTPLTQNSLQKKEYAQRIQRGEIPPPPSYQAAKARSGSGHGVINPVNKAKIYSQEDGAQARNVVDDEKMADAVDMTLKHMGNRDTGGRTASFRNWMQDDARPRNVLDDEKVDTSLPCYGQHEITGMGGMDLDYILVPKDAIARNLVQMGVAGPSMGAGLEHPAVFPWRLPAWFIRLLCPLPGTVLDPFMGSGSTAIAAEKEGRKWIGIERSEKYAKIATERLRLDRARRLDLPAVLPAGQATLGQAEEEVPAQ